MFFLVSERLQQTNKVLRNKKNTSWPTPGFLNISITTICVVFWYFPVCVIIHSKCQNMKHLNQQVTSRILDKMFYISRPIFFGPTEFADWVHVGNHWVLVHALPHTRVRKIDYAIGFVLWSFRPVVHNKESVDQLTWQR